MSKKIFDFCCFNPPYQDQTIGDNDGFAPPVYNKFLDEAYKVADKVEAIHPARFLFNAGSTPKAWNQKMLSDPHFKVLHYESDSSAVFANTDIKGGIVISYRDSEIEYGAIDIFTPYEELNAILHRVINNKDNNYVSSIAVSGYSYHFTEKMHEDFPELKTMKVVINGKEVPLLSKGHEYDLKSNIIEKLPMVFNESLPNDGSEYIQIVGRANNERVQRYVKKEYINTVVNLDFYKIFMPKASGVGAFGEALGPSMIVGPGVGHTETFYSIGCFKEEVEANNALKYLKTKFARTMLSVLKTTQNITPGNWDYVPLQDFTDASDIDWSKSIHEIDLQLYCKYGLNTEEVTFIESNVKEME